MAATIARAIGRSKETTTESVRLGPESAEAQANTFKTFTTCKVEADGSGIVKIERLVGTRRVLVCSLSFGPEDSDQKLVTHLHGEGYFTGGGKISEVMSHA